MPRKKLTIDFPHPCDEPWEMMPPAAGGRHCESCAKTVVDLSNASDQQLIDFFSQPSSAGTCCRLRGDQLKRTIQEPPERSLRTAILQRAAALVLAAQVLATDSIAQTTKRVHQTARPAMKAKPRAQTYLKGRIAGWRSQHAPWAYGPIPIRIGDSVTIAVTPDSNLQFRIPLPAGFRGKLISWELQEIAGGMILDDSVRIDEAVLAGGIELQWQAPVKMPTAMVRTYTPRVFGGLPVVQHEPVVVKRSFFQRVFNRRQKTQR